MRLLKAGLTDRTAQRPGETPAQYYQRLQRQARDEKWEEMFLDHCTKYKLTAGLQVEYLFHADRKWRLDFAWPDRKIAVEIDGGTRSQGRHNRHEGYTEDCIKINNATAMGWRVYRFPGEMVKTWAAADFMKNLLREALS
jgi:very-short-patch-repair endonuclease